ncbi:MAG: glutamate-5-semialdehyde dehydrogenase [Halanaerobiales bacterium]|nr:glutamate-5-semialdehyde dehydrogenase [Halanaerobiales bacterium]
MQTLLENIGKQAQISSKILANVETDKKNQALLHIANSLEKREAEILQANQKDLVSGKEKGLSNALMDRLLLTEKRIKGMADNLRDIAKLEDPIGEVVEKWRRPNGLEISKIRVPLGVIGIIYESRPNVTIDAAALCLKAGNAVILRGGSEAFHSNQILTTIAREALTEIDLPADLINLIPTTDRLAVQVMLKLRKYINLLIPRGGAGLIQMVVENSSIPVIETGVGNCHIYVDETADLMMALKIIKNSKVQRPGVCNAMETLLVHQEIAEEFLPLLAETLWKAGVELRCCMKSFNILDKIYSPIKKILPAEETDWETEYLDLILAVKIVMNIDETLNHIAQYGTSHSEAIITQDFQRSREFQKHVDAAVVYVNASTRFTDGSQFGMGGEIGISTQKLHARGPMGLKELTSTKYLIFGEGQIRK